MRFAHPPPHMAARLLPGCSSPFFADGLLLHPFPALGGGGKLLSPTRRRRLAPCCSFPWEIAALSLAQQHLKWRPSSSSMALLDATAAPATGVASQALAAMWANRTFAAGMVAWAVALGLKKVALRSAVGMVAPSPDSAVCAALTTSVALTYPLSHPLFPVCLGFALIVMYDAAGVRRHAGLHAQVLNSIVEDRFRDHPLRQRKLKELLGHTPLQVGAGAVVGILVGYLCSQGCN